MAQNFANKLSKPIEIVHLADAYGNIVNPIGSYPATNAQSSPAIDAFGRQRVSNPLTLFDSSHRYRDNNLWNTYAVGTGTTYTFNQNQGLIELTIGTGSTSQIIRETTKTFAYQPGKSLLVMNTFVMNPAKTGLRQRVGYFGSDNGVYLELDGTNGNTLAFVERSIVTGSFTETRISQFGGVYGANDTGWSVDKLDGTGPSGITLDITKAQILWSDIEWLGLGTVRMGFIINGKFIHCHSFHHANVITSTYITTASLPLRYEISNTAGTGSSSTLKQICSTVLSEGGYELRGLQQGVGTSITSPVVLTTPGTYYPVVSVRLKTSPDRLDAIVILTALSIIGITNNVNYNWRVVSNGTTVGGAWVSAGADSAVEYNITGTSYVGGRILAQGYSSASNQSVTPVDILKEALFKFQLERNTFTGTSSEITLVASSSSTGSIHASMDWEEISR